MKKILQYFPEDENGSEVKMIHPDRKDEIIKTASLASDLKVFVDNLEINTDKIYVIVNALGAGEYYSSNRNGDFIGEDVIQDYYKTFEDNGHVYKHHRNKNPKNKLGDILKAFYNPKMHRVELVLELGRNEDEPFIQRLLEGDMPPVSMGMKTKYDKCSICGHESKKISEYCDHLKNEMNKVYPDGRKVMAINPEARFFDISFVTIPADRTALTMRKIASNNDKVVLSAALAKDAIDKEISSNTTEQEPQEDPNGRIYDSQEEIPLDEIQALAKEYPLDQILATLSAMRITPKPMDVQNLVLVQKGMTDKAKELNEKNACLIKNADPYPVEIDYSDFNEKLARDYQHLVPKRSLTKQHVTNRILEKSAVLFSGSTRMEEEGKVPNQREKDDKVYLDHEPSTIRKTLFGYTEEPKKSTVKNPILGGAALSGLYYGIQKANNALFGKQYIGKYDQFLMKHPWLIPVLLGGGAIASTGAQKLLKKESSAKNYIASSLISVPATYLYAGNQENKVRHGKPIGGIQNFVRKHPLLTSLAGSAVVGKGLSALSKLGSMKIASKLEKEDLEPLFEDLINK